MSKSQEITIDISPQGINYTYQIRCKQEPNGWLSCYIPGYNLFYSAKSENEVSVKGDAVTALFFKYWVEKEGYRAFLDEMRRLGFVAWSSQSHFSSNSEYSKMYKGRKQHGILKAKTERINVPHSFINSSQMNRQTVVSI